MILPFFFIFVSSKTFFFDDFEKSSIGTEWVRTQADFFRGKFRIGKTEKLTNTTQKTGLITDSANKDFAISRTTNFTHNSGDFIVQYIVHSQVSNWHECDLVLKLYSEPFDQYELDANTPIRLAFGHQSSYPSHIHFSVGFADEKTKKWHQHNMTTKLHFPRDDLSHFFRLIIRSDETFSIYADDSLLTEGSFQNASLFKPQIYLPEMIDDPNDIKPADWDERPEIDDPKDKKPPKWDENAPEFIPDPLYPKPPKWKDNEPLFIPDPNATKPEEWNDDIDGEWDVPIIRNPYCLRFGCGKWVDRLIPNPNYYGPFIPRKIPNKAYKGPYLPRQIPNPDWKPQGSPVYPIGNIRRVGFVGRMDVASVHVEDIYIGDSMEKAEELKNERWVPVHVEDLERVKQKEIESKVQRIESDRKRKLQIGWDLALDASQTDRRVLIILISSVAIAILVLIVLVVVCCRKCAKKQTQIKSTPFDNTQQKLTEEKGLTQKPTDESKTADLVTPVQQDKTKNSARQRKNNSRTPARHE
ncbi:putative Calnexin like protein [Blattamonas nauphoetae]|uniref:Calnexin like protein n=1 Tax=Blattamonas nauphoetae TaxID=2049346 RepID=A0ABQ9WXE0_9EUKA|nr:putative Calnexin like protein [Blattamonas nauphoetae]